MRIEFHQRFRKKSLFLASPQAICRTIGIPVTSLPNWAHSFSINDVGVSLFIVIIDFRDRGMNSKPAECAGREMLERAFIEGGGGETKLYYCSWKLPNDGAETKGRGCEHGIVLLSVRTIIIIVSGLLLLSFSFFLCVSKKQLFISPKTKSGQIETMKSWCCEGEGCGACSAQILTDTKKLHNSRFIYDSKIVTEARWGRNDKRRQTIPFMKFHIVSIRFEFHA